MKILFSLFLCWLLLTGSGVYAQSNKPLRSLPSAHESEGNVLLPAQIAGATLYNAPSQTTNAAQWQQFEQKHGVWTVLIDRATGTPHRAFGKSISITGYPSITSDNVEQAAMSFLREHADVMRINPDHLRLNHATLANGRWYISYTQTQNDLDVLLSEVELRIFPNGKVMAFGADYYNDIDVSLTPTLSYVSAVSHAADGMNSVPASSAKQSNISAQENTLAILPLKNGNTVTYKLVYRIRVETGTSGTSYLSYVDAHTGTVVWRYNTVSHAATEVEVAGSIKPTSPLEKETPTAFPYQYVTIDGKKYTTDIKGTVQADIQKSSPVTADLSGPYATMFTDWNKKAEAAFSGTLAPGTPLSIIWDNKNSHLYQRNLFYFANRAREYIKGIDPAMTALDIPLHVSIQGASDLFDGPNAFSSEDSITFVYVNDPSVQMAAGPSVFFHEYGHTINGLLYKFLGKTGGMINPACNEGTADVNAACMLDIPDVGRGVFLKDSTQTIRTLENNAIYPDSINGESHHDGLILAGAFWDLRKSVSLEFVRKVAHFARYGTPDDIDNGVAFGEWFVETLVADDDDGDISNGTPHAAAIVAAFNKHHIGTDLLFTQSFTHVPLKDTKEYMHPYTASFQLTTVNIPGIKPDSMMVVYWTNDSSIEHSIIATEHQTGQYTADIPAQPPGTIVHYYIRAWDPTRKQRMMFYAEQQASRPYAFLVGYHQIAVDNFEQNKGWAKGGAGDATESGGQWIMAQPEAIDFTPFGGAYIQPGSGHSGSKCLVTGATGGFNFGEDLLWGTTTITSPKYDLSALKKPVARYYRWLVIESNDTGHTEEGRPYLHIEVSGNGSLWTRADAAYKSANQWEEILLQIPSALAASPTFQVRFVAHTPHEEDASELSSLFKALIDDFEILSADDLTGVAENTTQSGMTHFSQFPNPFAQNLSIKYTVSQPDAVHLDVYNLLGEKIASPVDEYQMPGEQNILWNGMDNAGKTVPPGVYVLRLSMGGAITTHTVVRY